MKKLLFVVCLLLIAIPSYATIVEVGGGTLNTISEISNVTSVDTVDTVTEVSSGDLDVSGFSYIPVNKYYTAGVITGGTYESIVAVQTDRTVWTPTSGKKIVLMGVRMASSLATSILIETGSTTVIPVTDITASGVVVMNSNSPIWEGAIDGALTYTGGTALARTSVFLWGFEE